MFRLSRIFAAKSTADGLLPLYALFASVEQICAVGIDEAVARQKLNWWREECLAREIASSEHPVLRELQRTNVASSLDRPALAELFAGAEFRIDAAAPSGSDELLQICQGISQPQIDLELSIYGVDKQVTLHPGQAAINGLLQLIRERRNWWLPLKLLARHGLNRDAFADSSQAEATDLFFQELLLLAGEWGGAPELPVDRKPNRFPETRHLFVINSLNTRKLESLQKLQVADWIIELNRLRPSDVFAAWRIARTLA